MHGPSFAGDGAGALDTLADAYGRRISGEVAETLGRTAA